MRITIVEWPSEKKKPTATGRLFSCISFRVTLSMAAMWSASTACRRPKAVGQETQAQRRRVGVEHGQRQRPGGQVQADEEQVDQTDATPQGVCPWRVESWWRFLGACC